MAFQRKQIGVLYDWKSRKDRKPMVVRGARQVGKTTLVNQFAKEYEQFIALNLERGKDAEYFARYNDAKVLLSALLLERRLRPPTEKKTLLFIDEIQEVPAALSFLRFFYEDVPELHVIAAGSLLEHALSNVTAFPVGRVQYLYVFPMNFPEFLRAHSMDDLLQELEEVPIRAAAHHVAMDWFHKYALIGGMPEVVQQYVDRGAVIELSTVYESIWVSYQDDVPKYARNATEEKVIRHIMRTAPLYMDARVTFQGFGKSNYRSREVGESFRALDDAKVIQLIYPGNSVDFPLTADYRKSPRLQFLDTGLLNFALGIQADLLAIDDLSNSYRGALLPHLVTQELISMQERTYRKPHFWVRQKKNAQAEVDLVYPYQGWIIPVEIKSGKVGRLRSLHQFIDRAPHPHAVRMYAGNFSIEAHTTPKGTPFYLMNLPYYLTTYMDKYLDYFFEQTKRL